MKSYPSIPQIGDAPDELLESGHLWLLEKVDGAHLRFRLQQSGVVQFGDRSRVYDSADDLPAQYQHAVRHIQTQLDRQALEAAVEDVADIVFFGEAMQYQGIEYDWERTPSFLGFDIWSAAAGRFRPPDAVDGIFDRLGLHSVNALAQEVQPRDFNPDAYEIPQSAWYDGPAAGVVIRDKQGRRAKLLHPDAGAAAPTLPTETTAEALADRYGSRRRFERIAAQLDGEGRPLTVERLLERAVESCVRELDPRLFEGGGVDRAGLRSAIAERAQRFLTDS